MTLTIHRVWDSAMTVKRPTLDHLPERCVMYCGPATRATLTGYCLYPSYQMTIDHQPGSDHWRVRSDDVPAIMQEGAIQYNCGTVHPDTIQVYTGLSIQPPKGHVALLTTPLNHDLPYQTGSCIIEDWMLQPLYVNLQLREATVTLDPSTPVAQVIVLPDAKQPELQVQEASEEVWEFIKEYSARKTSTTPKNSRCYHETRRERRISPQHTESSAASCRQPEVDPQRPEQHG